MKNRGNQLLWLMGLVTGWLVGLLMEGGKIAVWCRNGRRMAEQRHGVIFGDINWIHFLISIKVQLHNLIHEVHHRQEEYIEKVF